MGVDNIISKMPPTHLARLFLALTAAGVVGATAALAHSPAQ